jgi:flagellar biosynthesis component FlhA
MTRARLRRRTGAVLPGVHFRDDAELEPAGFRIVLDGSVAAAGQLRSQRWYCPAHLAMALRGQVRAQLSSAPEAPGRLRSPNSARSRSQRTRIR